MKTFDLITPEGTRDLLFEESVSRRSFEEKLRKLFTTRGYSEVVTPELEFYDVFTSKRRYFSQESMYKLTDSRGRLLVLRPDSTLPIARLVATRLKNETFPLKLFYNQKIFRVNPKNSARDDEIEQAGIEIVGGDIHRSDLDALSLALEVMKSSGFKDFRFEIGDSAFFDLLIDKLGVDDNAADEIRSLIAVKNGHELREYLSDYNDNAAKNALIELPKLFGGEEVFERAENIFPTSECRSALSYLKRIFDDLAKMGIADKISVDLGMVGKADYYTGIIFKGYISCYGMPVLSGGRYDDLLGEYGNSMPATGFAVNVDAIAEAAIKNGGKQLMKKIDIIVYADDDCLPESIEYTKKLIKSGFIVENSVLDSEEKTIEYALKKGIHRVDIVGGEQNRIVTL